MSLESWNTVLQFASAVLLGLTFAVGAGAILTSHILGKRQSERISTAADTAAAANERSAKLELEAAVQREKAAQAELELAQLKEQQKGRHLTTEQRQQIVAALKKAGKGPIEVVFSNGDGEARAFAQELHSVLVEAGWPVAPNLTGDLITGVGVFIVVNDALHPPQHSLDLQHALDAVGILNGGAVNPAKVKAGDVALAVTTKPR